MGREVLNFRLRLLVRETWFFALGTSLSPVDDAINVECRSDGDVGANEFRSVLNAMTPRQ